MTRLHELRALFWCLLHNGLQKLESWAERRHVQARQRYAESRGAE